MKCTPCVMLVSFPDPFSRFFRKGSGNETSVMLISSICSTCHLYAIFGFQSNSYMMSLHVEIMSQNLCTVAKFISSLIIHQASSSIFMTRKTPSGMKKHHACMESEICKTVKMIFILLVFLRLLPSVWLAQCCCNLS